MISGKQIITYKSYFLNNNKSPVTSLVIFVSITLKLKTLAKVP